MKGLIDFMRGSMFLVTFFLFSLNADAAFSDVADDHPFYAATQWLEARSVIAGYEDGTFRPDQAVNRAEALKMILLTAGLALSEFSGAEEAVYTDVPFGEWYHAYIYTATERSIVSGYGDGTFQPEKTVNLAEALKMMLLAHGLSMSTPSEAPYADVAMDAWFAGYVAYAKDRSFIEAASDGLLHPDALLTRGELAELLYRLSYTTTSDLSAFPIELNWPLVQHPSADIAFKVPFGWEMIEGEAGHVILWHADGAYDQPSWTRTLPNSAAVSLLVDANAEGSSQSDYFSAIQTGLTATGYEGLSVTQPSDDSLLAEYHGTYENFRDITLALPDGTFAVIQATYGTGLLENQLADFVSAIESSVIYSPASASDPSETIEQARSAIQVEGQGQSTLALFSDLELIETDTIGVGTGPVDYYYSVWADVTLKYERSFDMILDLEEGRTTAF